MLVERPKWASLRSIKLARGEAGIDPWRTLEARDRVTARQRKQSDN